ncbi:hypothetical protein NO373_00555 [Escherichia coli]|nr:hypothetical protein [Escherichia coli]
MKIQEKVSGSVTREMAEQLVAMSNKTKKKKGIACNSKSAFRAR